MAKIVLYLVFVGLLILSLFLIYKSVFVSQIQQTTPPVVDNNANISPAKKLSSDLSYIMVNADQQATITLFNSSGKKIVDESLGYGITDPGTNQSSGPPFKEINYAEPTTGIYSLQVNVKEKSSVKIEIYLYDRDGEVLVKKYVEKVTGSVIYKIIFDKDDSKRSSVIKN